jgi:hypothetical protein
LFVLCSAGLAADIPKLINYQGMLTNISGEPLNGTFDTFFRIHNAPSFGDKRWEENHAALSVNQGLFNVILGSQSGGIHLDFSEEYWLEVVVEGEVMPRVRFTSVGYAYRAMVADSAASVTPGSGSNWTLSGSVLQTNEHWGIARGGAWNVLLGDSTRGHVNLGEACTTGVSGQDALGSVVGGGRWNKAGWNATVGGGTWNRAAAWGSTIGGGESNNAWDLHTTVGGGIGNKVTHHSATIGGGESNTCASDHGVIGGGLLNADSGWCVTISGGAYNRANGNYAAIGGGELDTADGAWATIPGGRKNVASGKYSLAAGRRAKALHDGSFIWADSMDSDFSSISANEFAVGAAMGLRVQANSASWGATVNNEAGGGDGLRAYANVSSGNNWGAIYAINYGTSPSIYSSNSSGGLAAYFNGGVYVGDTLHVVGHVSKGGGSFKIDHPLDPENKYLYHSFVESPDMMNVYNGNVMLDANGEARVDLPEWFEALNRDCRYQLTPIGQPGPNLYVAQEISGNSFEIAGGEPDMKVSWQVTGIRQDAYAQKNRIPVEEEKSLDERGRYLYPEAYDLPETMGISYTDKKEKVP